MKIIILLSAILLVSCKATQSLSVYSLNNTDLESVLVKELPKLNDKISLMGIPVEFGVNKLNVDIGPDNRDVVALSLDSSANIKAMVFNYPISLKFTVEGSPYYDSKEKAIFLRNVNLLDSQIDAGAYRGNLKPLNNEAMKIINRFLDTNPVYRLDMNDPRLALFSTLPLDMKVASGAITIVPSL